MRNIAVHNNGIPDIDCKFEIEGLATVLEKGRMAQVNLKYFPHLIDLTLERYNLWVRGFALQFKAKI